MRETKARNWRLLAILATVAATVIYLVLAAGSLSLQAHAEEIGKVTVKSANVRKEASTTGDLVGGLKKGDTFTITGETTGDDGAVWYKITIEGGIQGYIRSNLVEKNGENANDTVTAQVTKLNPVSATVTGKQVNVRKNCTTTSTKVASVKEGTAMTITGKATAADGKVWYQVSFIENGAEVSGFIHSDYVKPAGELTPYEEPTQDPVDDPVDPPADIPEDPVEEPKDWDTTQGEDGKWMLTENATGKTYPVDDLIKISKENATKLTEANKALKSQKTWIVVLVIFLVLLAAAVGFLVFKFREELLEMIPGRDDFEIKKKPIQKQRPAGQRPAASQGQRPASPQGQRPAASQGQRPASPQGQRPAAPQGQRPVAPQGQRPATPQGQRPAAPQGQRPVGESAQDGKKVEAVGASFDMTDLQNGEDRIRKETAKNLEQQQIQKTSFTGQAASSATKKPKNFMVDDDEFAYEFLNWDGSEEKK